MNNLVELIVVEVSPLSVEQLKELINTGIDMLEKAQGEDARAEIVEYLFERQLELIETIEAENIIAAKVSETQGKAIKNIMAVLLFPSIYYVLLGVTKLHGHYKSSKSLEGGGN